MSKERLEEIKNGSGRFTHLVMVDEKDFEWLIRQTEHVQMLEEHNLKYFDMRNRLRKENKRLEDENIELAAAYNNARKEIRILKNKIELLEGKA